MAEATIFILIVGLLVIAAVAVFDITWINPNYLIGAILLLLLPGLYAALTSPFIPSNRERHKAMFKLAGLKPSDVVYDLGCGDGRLVFHAAVLAQKAIGYELSIPLYLYARLKKLLTRSKGQIRYGSIWNQHYADADVIFCYLLPGSMKKFYKEVWPTLKPGTRVISNSFQIHDLKPVAKEKKVYLYQV